MNNTISQSNLKKLSAKIFRFFSLKKIPLNNVAQQNLIAKQELLKNKERAYDNEILKIQIIEKLDFLKSDESNRFHTPKEKEKLIKELVHPCSNSSSKSKSKSPKGHCWRKNWNHERR